MENNNSFMKKIIWTLVIIFVIGLIVLLWLKLSSNPTLTPEQKTIIEETKKRIELTPKPVEEVSEVLSYSGTVQSININSQEFNILTIYGDKIVAYDDTTTFKTVTPETFSNTPTPPGTSVTEPTANQTVVSAETVEIGDQLKAVSLTNIRGLDRFKANTIFIIK